jgi:hypothetical protein
MGAAAPGAGAGDGDGAGSGSSGSGSGGSTGAGGSAIPDVDLVALADHVGQSVRVGGLVEELATDGFLLNDGTAIGRVVLVGEAAEYLPLIEPGDALNATGRVEPDGEAFRVVVTDAAGLARVGDPTAEAAGVAATDLPAAAGAGAPARLAGGLFGAFEPGAAGMVGVMLLSAVSLAVTALRRRRSRRLLAARVAARLARVAGPPPG